MRRSIVIALAALEVVITCAIFACALQLSQALAQSRAVDSIAASMMRSGRRLAASTRDLAASTRRLAIDGVRVRITISDA